MKIQYLLFLLSPVLFVALIKNSVRDQFLPKQQYVKAVNTLTPEAALELAGRVNTAAAGLGKHVSLAFLDASGTTLLILRGDGAGPHNTEAARRKAYTALSTETSTLELLRNSELNTDTKNLNTLPELLLLSGGVPILYQGDIIGSIGVAGGGSPENDNSIAMAASIPELGITTKK